MSKHFRTERALFNWLVGKLGTGLYQRIETTTGSGIPDTFVCAGSPLWTGWLELKVTPKMVYTAEDTISVQLRPAQHSWIAYYTWCGGQCAVVIGCGSGMVVVCPPESTRKLLHSPVKISDVGKLFDPRQEGHGLTHLGIREYLFAMRDRRTAPRKP